MGPKGLVITIDGPAGAGKSTVGRRLAQELSYLFLDTGAMYRAVGLSAKRMGLDPGDQEALTELCQAMSLRLEAAAQGVRVFVDDEEVTHLLRTPEIDYWASVVARVPGVRTCLKERQRAFAAQGGVVAEGRDMGSVVFPDADLKFFLTASEEERARRRYRDLKAQGLAVSFEKVLAELRERDQRDQQRETAPLVVPQGALVIDTSGLDLEEVLALLLARVKEILQARG